MDTLVLKPASRKRRRHSEEFKRQVVEACLEPGVSVAAIALANGLNANYLRRWVCAAGSGRTAKRLSKGRIWPKNRKLTYRRCCR